MSCPRHMDLWKEENKELRKELQELNGMRDSCKHYEFTYDWDSYILYNACKLKRNGDGGWGVCRDPRNCGQRQM